MEGKYLYFALAAFVGVLCALVKFLPFFLVTFLTLYLVTKYKRFTRFQLLAIIVISIVFFLVGERAENNHKSIIPESNQHFLVEYIQDPKIDGDLIQIQGYEKRFKEKLLMRYKIKSEAEKQQLQKKSFYRCVCSVTGTLKKPAQAKNPNGFNYREYLAAKGIYWVADIQESPLQVCTPLTSTPLVMIKQLRFSGIEYLEQHFPPEMAALSAALIFGDRSMFSPDLLSDYQKTGIVHLLAISGLHVSLLIGMVFYIGIRIGLTRQFMTNLLLVVLPIYVILTGSSPSVIRSALMIFLVLVGVKWRNHLKLLPIDSISLASMVFLLFSPYVIFDVGFQLSFSVSFAIILSASYILQRYQRTVGRMLATSVTAQLSALPFLLYHYFEVSIMGILANFIYIPLFSFVYLPALYLLFFIHLLFGSTPRLFIIVLVKIIHFFNELIGFFSYFSFTTYSPGRPNLLILFIYIVLIVVIFFIWEKGAYTNKPSQLIALVLVLLTFQTGWNWLNPYGEVTMIDVGQGDSILIHLAHGKGNYLIDTGGTMGMFDEEWKQRAKPFEVGRDVVVPYLKGKGITRIDKLILTHGDMDHIGGALSVLSELEVKQILMPSVTKASETELAIIHLAKKQGIPVIKVSTGNHWQSDGNDFDILSPEKNFTGERNSGSIAIAAQIGGLNWFFGGDLDQVGEERILHRYPHLTIDVLKAGHHGSKTSSADAFIRQIKPRVALISAGEHNRFGHPHQEVLDRLNETNTIIYRTDFQGAITYRFYHGTGTFSTFLP